MYANIRQTTYLRNILFMNLSLLRVSIIQVGLSQ